MLGVPPELARLYDTRLERKGVAVEQRPHYKKWLRFYWDFCHKYSFEPTDRQSPVNRAQDVPDMRYHESGNRRATLVLLPDLRLRSYQPQRYNIPPC